MVLMLGVAALMMSACESYPWKKKERSAGDSVTVVGNGTTELAQQPSGYGAGGVYGTSDYKSMTSLASSGSVELYNLDTGESYGSKGDTLAVPPPAGRNPDGGLPLVSDRNVTVYPLGDSYEAYGQYAQAPQGGMGMYNENPFNFGSGGADRGKLPSRSGPAASSIYFPYGSANISGSDRSVLRNVAETAKFAPVDRVVVEGHASVPTQANDPVEGRILNLRQSLKRAEAVSKTLIQEGVPAEKIKTVGWGDTKLSPGSEAEQRRVDIITAPGASGY